LSDDYVNLDGVFQPHHKPPPGSGVYLHPYLHYDDLEEVVDNGGFSKFNIHGLWMCDNSVCGFYWQAFDGWCSVIWNDAKDIQHYQTKEVCVSCANNCIIIPVGVFVEYLSLKGFRTLRTRVQRNETRLQPGNQTASKVHVLANRGTQHPLSTGPHPGRILGPDGKDIKWLQSRDKDGKE